MKRRTFARWAGVSAGLSWVVPMAQAQLPVQRAGSAQIIELNLAAQGTRIPEIALKVRVKEDARVAFVLSRPDLQAQYRLTIVARRPSSLPPQARRLVDPIAASIRIDSSTDGGETWMVEHESGMMASSGSSVAATSTSATQSTHLTMGPRLVSDAEHKASVGSSTARQAQTQSSCMMQVSCGRYTITIYGPGCIECGGIWNCIDCY